MVRQRGGGGWGGGGVGGEVGVWFSANVLGGLGVPVVGGVYGIPHITWCFAGWGSGGCGWGGLLGAGFGGGGGGLAGGCFVWGGAPATQFSWVGLFGFWCASVGSSSRPSYTVSFALVNSSANHRELVTRGPKRPERF